MGVNEQMDNSVMQYLTQMYNRADTDTTGAAKILADHYAELWEIASEMEEDGASRERIIRAMAQLMDAWLILFDDGERQAEKKGSGTPYKLDTIDAAMAAIDKLNAMAWLLVDAFDGGTPSDSVTSGIHAVLTESTDALAAFVSEVRESTRGE